MAQPPLSAGVSPWLVTSCCSLSLSPYLCICSHVDFVWLLPSDDFFCFPLLALFHILLFSSSFPDLSCRPFPNFLPYWLSFWLFQIDKDILLCAFYIALSSDGSVVIAMADRKEKRQETGISQQSIVPSANSGFCFQELRTESFYLTQPITLTI